MRLRRTLVYVMWMTVFVGASACPLGPGTGRGESPPPRDDLTHAVKPSSADQHRGGRIPSRAGPLRQVGRSAGLRRVRHCQRRDRPSYHLAQTSLSLGSEVVPGFELSS